MIDDKPLIDAIGRAERAQAELQVAISARSECQASVAKFLTSGDTTEVGVSGLLAEEARGKLFISKIQKLEAAANAATLDLKNSLGGIAEAARDEVRHIRARLEARAEAFLCDLPCFPDQVPQLVKQIVDACLDVRVHERYVERAKSAANLEDHKRLVAAARDVLSQRPKDVAHPQRSE